MMQPRRERIIYTQFNGGVSIFHPSAQIITCMANGGYWNSYSHGFIEVQIERQVARGVHEWAARRYCQAMTQGGCTDAEALAILRDRDCLHLGTAHELIDISEIPTDRWFRDAWCRSHNGGPVYISMLKARKIQLQKLQVFATKRQIDLRWSLWRERIRSAKTPEQLKLILPKGR